MTIETNTTIELGDIKTIEFECRKCHTKIVYPIESYSHPPTRCSACENAEQWLIHGAEDWMDLDKLGRILQRFSQTGKGRFALRLGISIPAMPSISQKSEQVP
jgi:DNA replicative helicase MCM subunit Mcm2 (Cdc46/Mcm family)